MEAKNKAVFLDRDGVINHDPGDYTRSLSEFKILNGVFPALKKMNEMGYLLILITNQGGIAKGIYGHEQVREIHDFFLQEAKKHEVVITDIYYSPHHDEFGKSLSRKPRSLMIERGLAKYHIDPAKSWMIGDKQRDLDAASKVGVKGILLPVNGPLSQTLELLSDL